MVSIENMHVNVISKLQVNTHPVYTNKLVLKLAVSNVKPARSEYKDLTYRYNSRQSIGRYVAIVHDNANR